MLNLIKLTTVLLAATIVAGAVTTAPVRAEEAQTPTETITPTEEMESPSDPTPETDVPKDANDSGATLIDPTETGTTLPPDGNLQLDEDPESKLAWINVSNIQELAAALGTANVTIVSDTDLYLKRDIMVNDIIGINAGTYNLDFRGFHISSYDYVNIYDANMTFFDSSASQSGGIHGPEDATSTYWGVKGGSLTIKSGTYTGKDSLFSLSGGALTIEGGRFTSRGVNEWSSMIHANTPDNDTESAQLDISGGSFEMTGEVTLGIYIGGNVQANISNATVKSDYIGIHYAGEAEGYLHIRSGSYYGKDTGLGNGGTPSVQVTGGTFSCDPNQGYGGVVRYGNVGEDSDTVFCMLANGYMYDLPLYRSEESEAYGGGRVITTRTQPKVTVISSKSVEGFVDRLYTKTLERQPDLKGFQNWVSQLKAKTSTGSGVAFGFFFSSEFVKKNISDDDFVTRMYRVFFNREPDAAGKQTWLNALENGASRKYVFAGFANSKEWKSLCDLYKILPGTYASDEPRDQNIEVTAFVQRLYTLCLNRKADAAGINNWTAALNNRTQDGAHVAYGFFFSSEFTNRKLSNGDYVEILYKVLLGRSSDSKGKAGWVAQLKAGKSRLEIFRGFAHSQEFEKICAEYGIVRGTV